MSVTPFHLDMIGSASPRMARALACGGGREAGEEERTAGESVITVTGRGVPVAARVLQVRIRCVWLQAPGVLGRGGRLWLPALVLGELGPWHGGQMGPKMVENWERGNADEQ